MKWEWFEGYLVRPDPWDTQWHSKESQWHSWETQSWDDKGQTSWRDAPWKKNTEQSGAWPEEDDDEGHDGFRTLGIQRPPPPPLETPKAPPKGRVVAPKKRPGPDGKNDGAGSSSAVRSLAGADGEVYEEVPLEGSEKSGDVGRKRSRGSGSRHKRRKRSRSRRRRKGKRGASESPPPLPAPTTVPPDAPVPKGAAPKLAAASGARTAAWAAGARDHPPPSAPGSRASRRAPSPAGDSNESSRS